MNISNLTFDANSTLSNWQIDTSDIVFISLLFFSTVFDAFGIYIFSKSTSNLVRIELFLLSSLSITSIPYKIILILFYLGFYQKIMLFGPYTFVANFSLLINGIFIKSLTQLYYSLYHLTFLMRNRIFLTISNAIQKPRNFIIFTCFVLIYSLIFTLIAFVLPSLKSSNSVPNPAVVLVFHLIIPSLLPPFVYMLASVITYFSRLPQSNRLSYRPGDNRRFNNDLKLFLKFLIIALLSLVCLIPKMIYFVLSLNCLNCITSLRLVNYISDGLTLVAPFYLIYMNKILRRSFLDVFSSKFNIRCLKPKN